MRLNYSEDLRQMKSQQQRNVYNKKKARKHHVEQGCKKETREQSYIYEQLYKILADYQRKAAVKKDQCITTCTLAGSEQMEIL